MLLRSERGDCETVYQKQLYKLQGLIYHHNRSVSDTLWLLLAWQTWRITVLCLRVGTDRMGKFRNKVMSLTLASVIMNPCLQGASIYILFQGSAYICHPKWMEIPAFDSFDKDAYSWQLFFKPYELPFIEVKALSRFKASFFIFFFFSPTHL